MQKTTIVTLCRRFQKHQPHPTTELVYQTPFQLLVAVILSAQATDKSVNKVTHVLFQKIKTPYDMQQLTQNKIEQSIKSIGLYKNKAKHIFYMCRQLIEDYQGKIPSTREQLLKLAGVGQKTANVILNTLYHQPVIAVDTHVFRVARRVGLSNGKTPLEVERDLEQSIPKKFLPNSHHWFVLHGRYVCKARKPACDQCFINDLCEYFKLMRNC